MINDESGLDLLRNSSPDENCDFRVRPGTRFAFDGKQGVISFFPNQGADCDTYLFTPENGNSIKMLKFVKDRLLNIGSYEGSSIEEKANDIRAFYERLRLDIGDEIVESKIEVIPDLEGIRRIVIVQNYLEGETINVDDNSPTDIRAQEDVLNKKYRYIRDQSDFPERWKRRTYDFGFDDNYFLTKGRLVIVDWL